MEPYRIMSFDGGGIRGLSYLPVIERIERHVGTNLVESGHFNMLVGTSTGAIIATGLAIGMTAKDIEQLYLTEAERIFRRNAPWHRVVSRYSSQRLFEVLDERLGPVGRLSWKQFATDYIENKVELVVVLWHWSMNRTTYLSTNLDRPGQVENLHSASVADVVTACCSAPYYFPPRSYTLARNVPKRSRWRRPYFRDEGLVFCDGGITGLNNPTALGLTLAQSSCLDAQREVHVLSFGAGISADRGEFGSDIRRWWLLPTLLKVIDAMFTSTAELMMRFHILFGTSTKVKAFLRTNQYVPRGSELDDIEGIDDYSKHFQRGEIHYLLYDDDHPAGDAPTDDLRSLPRLTEENIESILSDAFGIHKPDVVDVAPREPRDLPDPDVGNVSVEATSNLTGRLVLTFAIIAVIVVAYAVICLLRDIF